MGSNICGTNFYEEIKKQYPQQFSQFLIGQELKKSINQQIDSTKNKVSNTANDIQKENLGIIQSKQNQVKTQFQNAKQQIDKQYLGGLKAFEQTKNAKAQDILGYTEIQKKFQHAKDELNSKFTVEKNKVQQQLNNLQQQQNQKISKDQPQIPFFDQLTEKAKNQVYSSGLKEYKDQIEAQSKAILTPLQDQTKPDKFTGIFKKLLSLDNLKNLVTNSKEDINQNLKNYIGRPGDNKAYLG